MDLTNASAVVTGGASGLGLATAERLVARGVNTVLVDLPTSDGEKLSRELGPYASFAAADVTDVVAFDAALDSAEQRAPLRVLVHCAGKGGTVRVVERDGSPGSLEHYEALVRLNLIGTFNALRLSAARMAAHEPVGEERGVCVLTASVAAFEGRSVRFPTHRQRRAL